MIMTKVLLCNNEFDLRTETIENVEKALQGYIDSCTKVDLMKVKVWGGEHFLGLRVYRKYSADYKSAFTFENPDMIPCIDGDILLGRLGEHQKIEVMPPCIPYGYLFNYEITEFIKIYKANCKARRIRKPKGVLVVSNPSYIEIILTD